MMRIAIVVLKYAGEAGLVLMAIGLIIERLWPGVIPTTVLPVY
jgi:hypothetical protein